MSKLLKAFNKLRNIIEIYIPVAAFLLMFLTFIIQIIARYIFNYPLTWAYEVTVIGFSWTVILGACYAMRSRSHVVFTLIYDILSKRKAAIIRFLGNAIIIITFCLLLLPSMNYVSFMNFQATSVFKIKLSWIFAPFVYFLFSIILYTIEEAIEDFKIIMSSDKKELRDNACKEGENI
jgi:TRAP-type C4-dicarboxylate transport system permease small subunit